jgi:pyruvate/2-oxoglutarate/acetoin dehydrogenase E1 component
MPNLNIIQAVNDALRIEMRRDPRVVILGEDVGKFGASSAPPRASSRSSAPTA